MFNLTIAPIPNYVECNDLLVYCVVAMAIFLSFIVINSAYLRRVESRSGVFAIKGDLALSLLEENQKSER